MNTMNCCQGFVPLNVGPANTDTEVSPNKNVTESWIRFRPGPLHHQQIITCRATNYKLQGNNVAEDHRVLDIFCEYFINTLRIMLQKERREQMKHSCCCIWIS